MPDDCDKVEFVFEKTDGKGKAGALSPGHAGLGREHPADVGALP